VVGNNEKTLNETLLLPGFRVLFRFFYPAETDDDARCIDSELFEDEEPSGVDESKLLRDYLSRCCTQTSSDNPVSCESLNVPL